MLTCSGPCKQLGLNPGCATKILAESRLSTLLGWGQLPRKAPKEFDVGQRACWRLDQAFQKCQKVEPGGFWTVGR